MATSQHRTLKRRRALLAQIATGSKPAHRPIVMMTACRVSLSDESGNVGNTPTILQRLEAERRRLLVEPNATSGAVGQSGDTTKNATADKDQRLQESKVPTTAHTSQRSDQKSTGQMEKLQFKTLRERMDYEKLKDRQK